jgi:hypothetical protein
LDIGSVWGVGGGADVEGIENQKSKIKLKR